MYFDQKMREFLQDEHPTTVSMAKKIEDALKSREELKICMGMLDYYLPGRDEYPLEVDTGDDYLCVEAIVNTGASEGIYVDVSLRDYRGGRKVLHIATLKTLSEDIVAYERMGRLAGAITYIGQLYIYENEEKFCRRVV